MTTTKRALRRLPVPAPLPGDTKRRNQMKAELYTDKVYRTAGPYGQGVDVAGGRLIFTSGVLGRDVKGRIINNSDIAAQTRCCIENIGLILEAAGGSLKDVVRLNVVLTHPRNYDAMNAVRQEMLAGVAFTSVTIVGQLIDPNGLVEIDAIAAIGT
jgi:2-iminobutanoate/2-iminopropanoate deaminase